MIEITLSGTPMLPNVARTKHWAVKQKEAKKWREMAGWEAKQYKGHAVGVILKYRKTDVNTLVDTAPFPLKKVMLIIVRGASRPCDIDNGIASCKPIIDGLKDAGLIEDDNPNVVTSITFTNVKTTRADTFIKIQVVPID